MYAVLPMFGADEPLSCTEHSIAARAVRTPEDIQAFVQCAYEYVRAKGFSEARRAFHEDERWRYGQIYVFVADATDMTQRLVVFPPDPSREGKPLGPLVDAFGNEFFSEGQRILSIVDEGWTYYSFPNPATGRDEPKASYVKIIDWDGTPAAIGAGIYRRDIPGACNSEEVNAMLLDSDPSNERLKEFVRCAAMELEMKGYFAINTLTTEPRWKHGSIYLFAIDTYGYTLFSGDSYNHLDDIISELVGTVEDQDIVSVAEAFGESFLFDLIALALETYDYTLFSGDSYSEPDDIMSELVGTVEDQDIVSIAEAFGESFLFDLIALALETYDYTLFSGDSYSKPDDIMSELVGTVEDQDLVSVADAFGESFLYYTKRNPVSGMEERKVAFVKRVVSFGLPILIGAGYYLEDMEESP